MNRRGTVPLLVGILMVAMIGGVGVAVDSSRAWVVESRLQSAVDAAALAAARRIGEPTRDAEAAQVFLANLTQGGRPANYLGASISGPVVQTDPNNANRVRVSATAVVETTLFSVFGARTLTVSHSAIAQRAGTRIELAIVLDQTGSMLESAVGGGTKMDAAKSAVSVMFNTLFAGQDRQEGLYISLVPFTNAINIGTANAHMLDPSHLLGQGWGSVPWAGCVEVRLPPHDLSDAAPTGGARFRPSFWPNTFRQVGSVESGRCTAANAWPAFTTGGVTNRHCWGDNDWRDPATGALRTDAQMRGNGVYNLLRTAGAPEQVAGGPNMFCVGTPITPLTARRSQLDTALANINAQRFAFATKIVTGLQGAWYTLSPAWRGEATGWRPDPNTGLADVPPLPRDYREPGTRKIVVMLTDGDNTWEPFITNPCGSSRTSYCASPTRPADAAPLPGVNDDLPYSSFGRVTMPNGWNARYPARRINPIGEAGSDPRLRELLSATCAAMKAPGVEITIYVIGFEVSLTPDPAANRATLQDCASGPDFYFESPTSAQLNSIFQTIASRISSLSLVQ